MKTYTYAIGDIHGRLDVVVDSINLIEQHRLQNNSKAIVVFLGDYVDRGANSKEVCDLLMAGPKTENTEWVTLQGNHEIIMIEAGLGGYSEQKFWHNNGGLATLASFGGYREMIPYIKWMEKLPKYYRDEHRVFVHAGVPQGQLVETGNEAVLQWIRYKDTEEVYCPQGYVVHGHTPLIAGPLILQTRCDLDTLSYKTGRQAIAIFDNTIPGPPLEMLYTSCGYLLDA